MVRVQALLLSVVVASALALAGCGGGGGGSGNEEPPAEAPAPKIGAVTAATVNQAGTVFPTGRLVRIDVQETAGVTVTSGTIRIASASQNYDSGEQPLKFGSIFYEWDTTGLQPAADYAVTITLTDASNRKATDASLMVTLAPNPPAINKLASTVDLSAQAIGFPVSIVRTYLLDSKFDGPIGYGWTHSYRMRAVETRTNAFVGGQMVQVDGTVQIFNSDGTGSVFTPTGGGNYRSSPGDFRTLAKASDGSYVLQGRHGNRFTFARTGELVSLADRNGNTQTLAYDGAGRLASIADPSGRKTTFAYDANSRITSITDPLGRAVSYGYDGTGNLVSVTNHAGVVTRYDYDANHGLTTAIDPLGKRTFFTFDANRRLATVAGEGGANRLTFRYGVPTAEQMTVTDALGQVATLTYDKAGQVTRVVDAAGNASAMTYNAQRLLSELVDANGSRSTFTYDEQGNLLTSTDALGNTTTLTYAAPFNQIASLRDARGKTTAIAYDAQGNLTRMTYPGGASETYAYDAAGRLASKTDRKGQTIAYSYDGLGRLTRKAYPDGSSHRFAYDAAGNLVSAIDASGTIALAYDTQDRLVSVTYPSGDVVGYAYDAAGNRTRLVYPNGKTLDYGYDALNRLVQISEAGQMVARYAYDALGRVSRRNLKNGTFTTYAYDSASRLVDLVNRKSPTEIISSFAYTYDGSGNRLTMTTQAGTTRYAYDAIGQLINVVRPDSGVTQYNLDAAGNRVSVANAGSTSTYSTNDLNQYTAVGGDTYQYDANGNLTSKSSSSGAVSYAYDFDNRLVRITTPSSAVSYTYDPFGRRNGKINGAVRTDFIHDGLSVIVEKSGASVQATYVHGLRIDEVLVTQRGGVEYFYSQDGLGSVSDLTDATASVVESYTYDAYGTPSARSALGNPYLFTGREYEPESKIYFYRARFYDPQMGRFTSPDPLRFGGGDTNLYRFVHNNPPNTTDPLGLWSSLEWWKFSGVVTEIGCVVVPVVLGGTVAGAPFGAAVAAGCFVGELLASAIEQEPLDTAQTLGCELLDGLCNAFLFPGLLPAVQDLFFPIPPLDPDWPFGPPTPSNPGDPGPSKCGSGAMCAGDPTFVQTGSAGSFVRDKVSASAIRLMAIVQVPLAGSLVRGDVPIFGQAHGVDFKSYRLEVGAGASPTEWYALATSTVAQARNLTPTELDESADITIYGNLANWDTGLKEYVYLPAYPADHPVDFRGTYTLRLVVEGQDGQTAEDRVTVHVASVIPNAWGAKVTSKDGRFVLDVPEHAMMDSFRLVMSQPAEPTARPTPSHQRRVGPLWEVREPGERFTKEATLRLVIDEADLADASPSRLAIYGYDDTRKSWDRLASQRSRDDKSIIAKVRRLHGHYALFAGDASAPDTPLEPEAQPAPKPLMTASDPILIRNDFERELGQWSNRNSEVGGVVSLDARGGDEGATGSTRALKVANPRGGGNFAVNVISQPFDARDFPLVQFDYRIGPAAKTNFLVKVAGRWYDIGFTDDPKDFRDKRVNIASIGQIEGIAADDRWHTARFNLYEMLRTRTRHTVVEEMIMADWDVGGYMKLQFGTNAKGATYWIDDFSIGRDPAAPPRLDDAALVIDDFDEARPGNALGGASTTFASSEALHPVATFVGTAADGSDSNRALQLDYRLPQAGTYAGYVSPLRELDARGYQALSFRVRRGSAEQDLLVGLKDRAGNEHKVPLSAHLAPQWDPSEWQLAVIPLAAFAGVRDWAGLENVSLSFTPEMHAAGSVRIDDLAFERDLASLLVDDFERDDQRNALGLAHATQVAGAAAVNGQVVRNSPNRVYRLAYGGTIGVSPAADGHAATKSWARWATQLGAIDCSKCGALTFRIRGSEGGEDLTLYLDDGNFRWGVQLAKLAQVGTDWQIVSVPLSAFSEYGVDLSHLAELQVVFEGHRMSGTIFLDDIRLGPGQP